MKVMGCGRAVTFITDPQGSVLPVQPVTSLSLRRVTLRVTLTPAALLLFAPEALATWPRARLDWSIVFESYGRKPRVRNSAYTAGWLLIASAAAVPRPPALLFAAAPRPTVAYTDDGSGSNEDEMDEAEIPSEARREPAPTVSSWTAILIDPDPIWIASCPGIVIDAARLRERLSHIVTTPETVCWAAEGAGDAGGADATGEIGDS